MMETHRVIGMMSGTSLDGVDLAACVFSLDHGQWEYWIAEALTEPYPEDWKKALSGIPSGSAFSLAMLNKDYGEYLGELARRFIRETSFRPGLIASHGHTLFHQPDKGLTFQLGSGAAMAAIAGIPVVCDFRTTDLGYGGQGAPLVPIGDRLLFGDYTFCLNLGGFSNLSFELDGMRIAHDLSPCNLALNFLARQLGHDFDKDGRLAGKGKRVTALFEELNALPFYQAPPPKSLGREWFETVFLPLVERSSLPTEDLLRTVTDHIAFQVSRATSVREAGRMLVTGGGAHNRTLIKQIGDQVPHEVVVPDRLLVDFKEALVFALLGVLRFTGRFNVLGSVTGAGKDHCAGAVYL